MWRKILVAGLATVSSDLVLSAGVGDYIASGLDLPQSPAAKDADAHTATSSGDNAATSITRSLIKWHTSSVGNSSTSLATGAVSTTSTVLTASASPPVTTSISAGSASSNVSVDECWSSWEEYWSNSQARTQSSTSTIGVFTTTSTYTETAYPGTTEVYTSTIKTTNTIGNGGFAISTQTLDTTSTTSLTISSRPVSTDTYTRTYTSLSLLPYTGTNLSEPTCKLPSSVSQCQAQWEAYVTSQLVPGPSIPQHCDINYGVIPPITTGLPSCVTSYRSAASSHQESMDSITRPPCSQASIGGGLCSTVKDAYVYQQNYVFWPSKADQFAPFFSNGYLGSFQNITATNFNTSWFWPTSSTLGVPSCTLGCGRCAVTGGTVQLLYWPATATNNLSATGPVTLSTDGTVLTSPTYYISYRSVYASDGCSGVGPTHYNTIVPIPASETLSSVFGGTVPCDAHLRYTQEWLATASFNVTDMNSPVPFSIYSSQPWCATYQRDHGCHSSCPTDAPYKPLLVVPHNILRSMDPAWASCYGDLRGQYDPPIALHGVGSIAGPTLTAPGTIVSQTASATPASLPSDPAAKSTTATAQPDNLPTTSHVGPGSDPFSHAKESTGTHQGPVESPTSTGEQAASNSQDVGGVIASLLGDQSSATVIAQQATSASNQASDSAQGVAGVIASLLGGASNANTRTQAPVGQDPTIGDPTKPQGGEQTLAVGSQTIVVGVPSDQGSAVVVAGGQETSTLNPGGAAGTINGQAISALSTGGGVVVEQGGDAATVIPDSAGIAHASGDPAAGLTDSGESAAVFSTASAVSGPSVSRQNQQAGGSSFGQSAAGSPGQSTVADSAMTRVTIASAIYTAIVASPGVAVLANSDTTVSVPAAYAVSLDGQVVSFGDAGHLVAGSSTYTLLGLGAADPANGASPTSGNSASYAVETSTSVPSNPLAGTSSASATVATASVATSKPFATGLLGLGLLVALFAL